jgi:hypothetical protein
VYISCIKRRFNGFKMVTRTRSDPPCPWDESTCLEAVRTGNLEILIWLRTQDSPCPWDVDMY